MLEQDSYYWGIPTSTIDWCEENYVVSQYLAEYFNTTTNLAFVFLAFFGIYNTITNNFSKTFVIAHLAVLFVGIGSWFFHMTLQYEMQLLDELPMIYAACVMVWHIFEVHPQKRYGVLLPLFLVGYSAFVTYSYIIINNPVYHQVCYGLLVGTVVIRSVYVCHRIPTAYQAYEQIWMSRLLWMGAGCFGCAFLVWNIDNQFCSFLRDWRSTVGLPIGAISELHGWWHIGTSLGVYYFLVFCEWVHQVMNGKAPRYELQWIGPLCYLRPAKGQIKSN
ncbi:alkaline dihydroceramidase [Phascolomyces articulosus]|uniref:Alkaline dihydroceramidase n=1 Tax=Phascolomyces articulosus TaxID=60185 RepID=A0AAD5JXP6_9FUNG|nr:alkaline dihydroceramidase [Phascolomyces articulosus]